MFNGVGAPNGPGVQQFARWFRYPAGFSKVALNACFEAASLSSGSLVVDPFAGVATTGVQSIELGFRFIGIEVHPLIAEVAGLKFMRPTSADQLVEQARMLERQNKQGSITSENSLITRSFDAATLAQLVGLRQGIQSLQGNPWQLHLKWCLLGALRDCASAKVGWPYQRPGESRVPRIADPCRAFVRRAQWMASDLSMASDAPVASVHHGDARAASVWRMALGKTAADLVITSPPYLNNFDYADATRLELYFWGVAHSWEQMTRFVRSDMVVATTQQSRRATADTSAVSLATLCPTTFPALQELREKLRQERAKRSRGKEYDQVLPAYFIDLARVLINVRDHTVPHAIVALVLGDSAPYGVYVDTPGLLAQVAEELGFERVNVRSLRQRGLRWQTNGTRHSIDLTEQLVVLRSPGVR